MRNFNNHFFVTFLVHKASRYDGRVSCRESCWRTFAWCSCGSWVHFNISCQEQKKNRDIFETLKKWSFGLTPEFLASLRLSFEQCSFIHPLPVACSMYVFAQVYVYIGRTLLGFLVRISIGTGVRFCISAVISRPVWISSSSAWNKSDVEPILWMVETTERIKINPLIFAMKWEYEDR